jgi:hypothetical protein
MHYFDDYLLFTSSVLCDWFYILWLQPCKDVLEYINKYNTIQLHGIDVVFEVLTTVVTNCSVFWDITLCGLLIANRCFNMFPPSSNLPTTSYWFLAWLILRPEDGGNVFLQNIKWLNTLHDVMSQKTELSME